MGEVTKNFLLRPRRVAEVDVFKANQSLQIVLLTSFAVLIDNWRAFDDFIKGQFSRSLTFLNSVEAGADSGKRKQAEKHAKENGNCISSLIFAAIGMIPNV